MGFATSTTWPSKIPGLRVAPQSLGPWAPGDGGNGIGAVATTGRTHATEVASWDGRFQMEHLDIKLHIKLII